MQGTESKQYQAGIHDEAQQADVEVFKCKSCGSDLEYDAEARSLVCKHCGSEEKIAGNIAAEVAFTELPPDADKITGTETKCFRCRNCGATLVLDEYATSSQCMFCDATSVLEEEELPGLIPNGILPFTLTQEDAAVHYKKWIKRKLFAPRKLKKRFDIASIKGIYTPSFTFDSKVESFYKGRLGQRKTRTVVRNGKTVTETYIHWFRVSGKLNSSYNDILVESCHIITQKEIEKLQPFPTDAAKEYDAAYISGYTSLRYDTPISTCWNSAQGMMAANIRARIIASYHADVVDYLNVDNYYSDTSYKYVLLPIWFSSYKYRDKLYRFMVNACTGKTTGKAPLSPLKVGTAVLFGLGILAVIAYFILKYNGMA